MIPLFGENSERRHDVASEPPEIDRLAREPNGARVPMRKPQERVDQMCQTIDLFEHAAHGFLVFRGRTRFAQSDFSYAADHGQRRAELMRCVGGKSAKLRE